VLHDSSLYGIFFINNDGKKFNTIFYKKGYFMAVTSTRLDTLCASLMNPSNSVVPDEFPKISDTTRELFARICPTKTLPDLEGSLKKVREHMQMTIQLKKEYDAATDRLYGLGAAGALAVTAAVDYLVVEVLEVCGWKLALSVTAPIAWVGACYLLFRNRKFSISLASSNEAEVTLQQFKEFFSKANCQALQLSIKAKITALQKSNPEFKLCQTALAELEKAHSVCT
jgi:hypothetical protein